MQELIERLEKAERDLAKMHAIGRHQSNRVFYDDPTTLGARVHPYTCRDGCRPGVLVALYVDSEVVMACPHCTFIQSDEDMPRALRAREAADG